MFSSGCCQAFVAANARIPSHSKDEPLADDIFVNTVVAVKDNKRVLLHRVVKLNPDGTEEVFIIKASPKIIETNH